MTTPFFHWQLFKPLTAETAAEALIAYRTKPYANGRAVIHHHKDVTPPILDGVTWVRDTNTPQGVLQIEIDEKEIV